MQRYLWLKVNQGYYVLLITNVVKYLIYVAGWFGDILNIIRVLPVFQTVIGKTILKMILVSCTNVKLPMGIKEQLKGNMKILCKIIMKSTTLMNYIIFEIW